MKIRFFGTSDGIPRANRACTSLALETNGKLYVVDIGKPLVETLLKLNKTVDDVNAVFITHTHSDHICSLYQYASLVGWYYDKSTANIYTPESDLIDVMKSYYRCCEKEEMPNRVKFVTYNENTVFEDEFVRVTFIPTAHIKYQNRPTYAVMFECEGKRVLFSGDLSEKLKEDDYPKVLFDKKFDAVIMELAHFEMDSLIPYLSKSKIDNLFFNHVAIRDRREKEIRDFAKAVDYKVYIPNDDDCYEI